MRIEIELRIIADDDSVISADEVLHLDKSDDRLEAIGLSVSEAKAMLAGIQERVVTAQAASFLARHRCCNRCGRALLSKGPGRIQFRTAFGTIPLVSPRFHRCRCQPSASMTFSPLSELFTEHTAPELLYLETKWASLVSFGLTAELLKDLLPIGSTANACTIRRHLHKVAARHDADLGGEQPGGLDGGPGKGQPRPIPQAAVIVGIDGGYVRNWYDKKCNFEVMVGKSMAIGCNDRYFGLVTSQDEQSDRRLRAVLQDLPGTPAVTMLTDGGDSVRALAGELSPGAPHILDWFHIAMRLTGLGQYTRGLAHHNPVDALESRLERIKWRLWHGDANEALTRAEQLAADVAALDSGYPKLKRLVKATADLATYIANNAAALPDYSERWLTGERISFVESTVNLVVSRRFAKKQQMQWSKPGAHRLLQTRTKTLDGTLRDLFTTWYPAMAANDNQVPALAIAA